MKTSTEINKILPKLAKAMKELGGVKKSSNNPFFKSKYGDLNTHLDVAESALETQGLILLQPVDRDDRGSYVESIVLDPESSQFVSSRMDLVLVKQDMQNLGSAVTYARRYTLGALLSMQALDDDGNVSSGKVTNKPTYTVHNGSTSNIPTENTSLTSAAPAKRPSFRKNTQAVQAAVSAVVNTPDTEETTEGWE